MTEISIIGQGYVGLPLAILFSECGVKVNALDVDETKIDSLVNQKSYIKHIPSERIEKAIASGLFLPTTDFSTIASSTDIIICVPTPLDKHRQPDMSYVQKTAVSIARFMQPGSLVILESTAYPGATEELLKDTLETESGLLAGSEFHLAFSPEREDPGNPLSIVQKIPKLVGGLTEQCLKRAVNLYSQAIDTLVPVSSCKVAEAAKLTENIFRSVNIAMVNELKVIYAKMGIDVWEVIEAAKTKPFGYMPFYPGPGLGGHCIPIDPFYLSWRAKQEGITTRFIELAGEINQVMPEYVMSRLMDGLNDVGKSLNGSKILLIGMAYKKNVDDMRESPALEILDLVRAKKGHPYYYDPFIPVLPITREYAHWKGLKSISWDPVSLGQFDAAVIVTDHDGIPYKELVDTVPIVVDTRNALAGIDRGTCRIIKA